MAIHLVRHGSAGPRSYTHADGMERPLDQRGREQAIVLAAVFADLPIRAVWSSIAVRCVETITPTAEAHNLEVETAHKLTEGARSVNLIEWVKSEAHLPDDLVVCSHGDLIPEVINTLLREGMTLIGPRGCEKGSIWTLQTRGHDIVQASYKAKPAINRPK